MKSTQDEPTPVDTPEIETQIRKQRTQVFSEDTIRRYEAADMEPMAEAEVEADRKLFSDQTLVELARFEQPFAFFNHRGIWNDYNAKKVLTPKNIALRASHDCRRWWDMQTGRGAQAISVPEDIHKGPALIIGSGVSLDKALPHIKNWNGGIICSTSHASTLLYYGCNPQYIIAFDHRISMDEFRVKKWPKNVTLITHPGIDPEINASWRQRKMYFRIYEPSVEFYTQALEAGYPFITTIHYPFACSTSVQISLAKRMGFGPLVLMGVDLAYRDNKLRYQDWFYENRKWQKTECASVEETKHSHLMVRTPHGDITNWTFTSYREAILSVIWLDTPVIIDATTGIMNGLFPQIDPVEICEMKDPAKYLDELKSSPEDIRERLEPWLAMAGMWYIPFDNTEGFQLLRLEKWETQMIPFLGYMKEQFGREIDVDKQMRQCKDLLDRAHTTDWGASQPGKML